jgi:hypothetical protein
MDWFERVFIEPVPLLDEVELSGIQMPFQSAEIRGGDFRRHGPPTVSIPEQDYKIRFRRDSLTAFDFFQTDIQSALFI